MNHNPNTILKTIFLYFIGISSSFSQVNFQGFAQGTSYRILYYPAENTIQKYQIDSILIQLDSSLSIYKPYSLISQFNHFDTEEIVVDSHLKNVLNSSLKHWKLSRGKFDITVAPLTELYGFGTKKINQPPTSSDIKEALKKVGMRKIRLRGNRLIKKKKGVKIDVNGIAQGYSVDILSEFLEAKNVHNYLVELGGEIRTKGTHSDRRKFKIALEVPTSGSDSVAYQTLEIYNTAITTSGTVKRHHINPKNGKVFSSPILSATVSAPTAMDADAIDNYIVAMKPDKARKWAKKNNIELILIVGKK